MIEEITKHFKLYRRECFGKPAVTLAMTLLSFLLIQVVAVAEDHVFEQYLYDVACAKKAIADDGTVF